MQNFLNSALYLYSNIALMHIDKHLMKKMVVKAVTGPNSGLALEVQVASLVYDADACLCSSIQQPITLKVLGAGCWSSFTERRLQ